MKRRGKGEYKLKENRREGDNKSSRGRKKGTTEEGIGFVPGGSGAGMVPCCDTMTKTQN